MIVGLELVLQETKFGMKIIEKAELNLMIFMLYTIKNIIKKDKLSSTKIQHLINYFNN